MLSKRLITSFLGLVSIVVLVIAMIGTGVHKSIKLPFITLSETNSLTGASGKNGPVIVVKLDDTTFAHPQVGLRSADVIYIEQVEGGLTRLAAVFSSKIPPVVGPVRSARISDVDLLAQYGRVGFAYSGVQKLMRPVIAAANLNDLGANAYGPTYYANDPARSAPYAMMVKLPNLIAKAKGQGLTLAQSKSMGWEFGDRPAALEKIEKVHIAWPASSYDATWSERDNRWLLIHNGAIDTDDTGFQLGPKSLVIQIVSITDSIYHDKVGGVTPFSATVGSGKCYLLRSGGYIPCLWNRSSPESGTQFTDLSGNSIFFDPGQIWFALTAKEPIFTPSSIQGATKSTNK